MATLDVSQGWSSTCLSLISILEADILTKALDSNNIKKDSHFVKFSFLQKLI